MITAPQPRFPCSAATPARAAQRVETIQALRGLAALLVVLNHATNVIDERADILHGAWIDYQPLNNLGAIGVDIFFVISGLAMAEAVRAKPGRGPARYLIERFVRIMPLFWLMSMLTAAAAYALGRPISWASVANTVTMLPIYPQDRYAEPVLAVGWTLAFEWVFYALVAAGLALNRRHSVAIAMGLALALVLLSLDPAGRSPLGKLVFSTMYAEFAFGIGIAWLWREGRLASDKAGLVLLIAAAGGIGWTLWRDVSYFAYLHELFVGGADLYRALLWGLPAAALVAGALAVCEPRFATENPGRAWQAALLIGNASFSIYLVHLPVMWIAEATLPHASLPGEPIIGILSLASTGLGLAAYRWIEQPLLVLSRRAISGTKTGFLQPAAA